MPDMSVAKWTVRFSRWALALGIFALVLSLGGTLLARFDLVPKLMGFSGIMAGAVVAGIGTVFGLSGVIMNFINRPGFLKTALFGLVLAGGHFGFAASRAAIGSKVPAIHDISTDIANPPAFAKLKLSADNLRGVETIEKWREIHAKAYGDIAPITVTKAPAAVIADAERLAKERGWVVANADAAAGVVEATASVSLIRFQDDIVIRVRPTVDGAGSVVDMRSVSRVGISDLGVNAKRVREFLKALASA